MRGILALTRRRRVGRSTAHKMLLARNIGSAPPLCMVQPRACLATRGAMDACLTDELVQRYARDGAVVLRGLLSRDEITTLREAIDFNMAHPGPLAGVASGKSDPGRFFEDFCNWSRVPGYQDIIFNSALPEVAAKLMCSRKVRLYHDHVLVKEARTKQPTPWHQDQPCE